MLGTVELVDRSTTPARDSETRPSGDDATPERYFEENSFEDNNIDEDEDEDMAGCGGAGCSSRESIKLNKFFEFDETARLRQAGEVDEVEDDESGLVLL